MPAESEAASLERRGGSIRAMIHNGDLCELPPWVPSSCNAKRKWTVISVVGVAIILVLMVVIVIMVACARRRAARQL